MKLDQAKIAHVMATVPAGARKLLDEIGDTTLHHLRVTETRQTWGG